jgi:hypothetical protein
MSNFSKVQFNFQKSTEFVAVTKRWFFSDGMPRCLVIASIVRLKTFPFSVHFGARLKPKSLYHIRAAAVPVAAITAWNALFDTAQLQPGQRVLIHGGAGGVGHFAVQLAKQKGAHVIAPASAKNHELVYELGADEVIDYQAQKFEDVARKIDIVLDPIGGDTQERSWKVLKKGGVLVRSCSRQRCLSRRDGTTLFAMTGEEILPEFTSNRPPQIRIGASSICLDFSSALTARSALYLCRNAQGNWRPPESSAAGRPRTRCYYSVMGRSTPYWKACWRRDCPWVSHVWVRPMTWPEP